MNDKFITLSWDFIKDDRTTMQEKLILCEIQNLTMLEYGCIASNEHFATLMGIKKEAVSRLINSLVKKGFISSEIKNGSRNFSRRLTINNLLFYPKQNVISPLTKCLETKGNISINKESKGETAPKQQKNFTPPTIEDINTYVQENSLNVDTQKFFKYYTASNWKDNKGKAVKNWKLKLVSWDKPNTPKQQYKRFEDMTLEEKMEYNEAEKQRKIEANYGR